MKISKLLEVLENESTRTIVNILEQIQHDFDIVPLKLNVDMRKAFHKSMKDHSDCKSDIGCPDGQWLAMLNEHKTFEISMPESDEKTETENKKFKPFVEGQWVYSITKGWEKITSIDSDSDYPIDTENNCYRSDGKNYGVDKHPSIFHTDIFNGTQPPEPEPEPEIDWDKVPRDTEVKVSGSGTEWNNRYFCHRNNDGYFFCFSSAEQSKQAYSITKWNNCRLVHQADIEKYRK